MHIKSLALVAAAVMTAGAAQAADLNKPAKVAVDYVKVCDAYGAGFFYIPGSDTCLKISGFARLDVVTGGQTRNSTFGGTGNLNYNGALGRGTNAVADGVRADVTFDARTNTQYGLLRSYIDFHPDIGTSAGNASRTTVEFDKGYVQLGGLTAGRANSNYTFLEENNQEYYFEGFTDMATNLLAYTFTFGNGVSATVSLEDPTTSGYQNTASGAPSSPIRKSGATFTYGGLNVPDVVANLNVTQAWGAAQISGVLHQVYSNAATAATIGNGSATKYGYAIQAGVNFNIPTLGAGDTIGVQGAFGSGANGYVETWAPQTGDVGADAVVSGATLKLANTWTIGGVLVHNFTPNLTFNFAPTYYYWSDAGMHFGETRFSAQLDWKPVKGLDIMPDLEYHNDSLNAAARATSLQSSGSAFVFGVRIQRSF